MKKIIVMLLALAPMWAFAQHTPTKKTAEERVQAQTERMAQDLKLNEEQKAKVAAINQKYLEQARAQQADQQADKQARREAAKKLADAREQELKTVLTEEQYAKHLEAKAAHQQKRQAKIEKWQQKRSKKQ